MLLDRFIGLSEIGVEIAVIPGNTMHCSEYAIEVANSISDNLGIMNDITIEVANLVSDNQGANIDTVIENAVLSFDTQTDILSCYIEIARMPYNSEEILHRRNTQHMNLRRANPFFR
jgi:hypothetical protein